jgi:hypothetical protein
MIVRAIEGLLSREQAMGSSVDFECDRHETSPVGHAMASWMRRVLTAVAVVSVVLGGGMAYVLLVDHIGMRASMIRS